MKYRSFMSYGSYRSLTFALAAATCTALASCRSTRQATKPEEEFFKPVQSVDRKQAVVSPQADIVEKVLPQPIVADTLQVIGNKGAAGTESLTTRTESSSISKFPAAMDSSQIIGNVLLPGKKEPVSSAQPGAHTLAGVRGTFLARDYKTTAEGCEEMLRRGVPKHEKEQYLFLMGKSYYYLKRYDLAASSLKKVVNLRGAKLKPDAFYVLGLIYKELGVSRQARTFFEAAVRESRGSDIATQARDQLARIAPKK